MRLNRLGLGGLIDGEPLSMFAGMRSRLSGGNNMNKKKNNERTTPTLEDFLSEAGTSGEDFERRPVAQFPRDEVLRLTIESSREVENDYGTSTLLEVVHEGESLAWFLKGREADDFRRWRETAPALWPAEVFAARGQRPSKTNPDRVVNTLTIALV
jgi:hypothetical protein